MHEGSEFTDYLANNVGWFIVSKKFKNLIEKIDEETQFLPVNVVDIKSEKRLGNNEYFVANVLGVIDALNLENSNYSVMDLDGEKVYSVRKYAVSTNKIKYKNVFKLKGDEIPLFVSERFKQLVEESGITGCEFIKIINV